MLLRSCFQRHCYWVLTLLTILNLFHLVWSAPPSPQVGKLSPEIGKAMLVHFILFSTSTPNIKLEAMWVLLMLITGRAHFASSLFHRYFTCPPFSYNQLNKISPQLEEEFIEGLDGFGRRIVTVAYFIPASTYQDFHIKRKLLRYLWALRANPLSVFVK